MFKNDPDVIDAATRQYIKSYYSWNGTGTRKGWISFCVKKSIIGQIKKTQHERIMEPEQKTSIELDMKKLRDLVKDEDLDILIEFSQGSTKKEISQNRNIPLRDVALSLKNTKKLIRSKFKKKEDLYES